jgi:hypothetical protein
MSKKKNNQIKKELEDLARLSFYISDKLERLGVLGKIENSMLDKVDYINTKSSLQLLAISVIKIESKIKQELVLNDGYNCLDN